MAQSEINLIKSTSTGPLGILGTYEKKIRQIAWIALLSLLGLGLVIGVSYIVINAQYRNLEERKAQVTQQLKAATVKEGIVISLKQRVEIAQKALDVARPWGELFPLLEDIGPIGYFVTLTVEESGRVNTVIEAPTIDDAVALVTSTLDLAQADVLRSPQLLSLSLRDSGIVQIGLSFIPIF